MASSLLSGSKAFGSTHDLLMEGWEAKENKDGVVYFVNNELKITSWIHPYVSNVFEELAQYNDIKYAAYRTALKLRLLQVKLGLSWITVNSIKAGFSNIHVDEDCHSVEDCLSCGEAFNIIHDILEMSDSLRLHRNHLLSASEMILNLILELYDTNRSGKLACRSIRIALVALCSAKLSDKYRFFFNEISDSQGHIQREKFLYLIYDLMQITEILKESTAFGTNVSAAVNSCLNDSDQSSDGNSQDMFFTWLLHEPQTLIWLPTLHRVVATENIQHNVQCSVCDINPIIGFRYRCMQCFNFDLCQSCFFHGRYSQGHRLKHPMQEYCFPTTAKDNTKALLKIMRNKISRKHRQTKIKFLPIDDDSITGSVFQWQPRSLIPLPRDSFCSSTDSGLAVGSGSGEFRVIGSHDEAVNDVVVGKGWSKSVEVLGDPCDTSSPCLQQDIMSKKNMDNQQLKMAEAIQQLQEENRILRQKLSVMRRQDTDDEEKYMTEETVTVEVLEKSLSLYPLKEITTDEPISPIKSGNSDRQSTTSDSCLGDEKCELKNRNVSVDVLEIVGCCTPTPSSFCTENKNSSDGNESGINEDEVNSDAMSVMSQKSTNKEEEVAIALLEAAISKHENQEPVRNLPVLMLQTFTDTETESTTSNDLEYTYSDMSLKSEMSSRAESMRKGQVIFSVEHTTAKMQDKGDLVSTPQPFRTPDPSYISVQSTPYTTKNDTLELDAFRLCRMKFGAANESVKKLDRQNSDGSEPRLVYTSSLKDKDSRKGKSNSFQATKQKSKDETNDFASHSQNSHPGSFELSEIPTQGSYASFAQGVKPLSSLPVNTCRTKTPEPVFMSTPVTNQMYFVPHESAVKKRSASAKVSRKREEKENRTPLNRGDSSSYKDVRYSRKEPSTPLGVTPKSSLPPWQRQRILRSVDGLHSNRSYSCNDLTTGGEVGMTTLFDKAEHHRTVGAGSNSLALEDKEELERILEKVAIGNSQCSELPLDGDMVSNSSMLQAVMNVGDAMADFVHATAEVQMHHKESSDL